MYIYAHEYIKTILSFFYSLKKICIICNILKICDENYIIEEIYIKSLYNCIVLESKTKNVSLWSENVRYAKICFTTFPRFLINLKFYSNVYIYFYSQIRDRTQLDFKLKIS